MVSRSVALAAVLLVVGEPVSKASADDGAWRGTLATHS